LGHVRYIREALWTRCALGRTRKMLLRANVFDGKSVHGSVISCQIWQQCGVEEWSGNASVAARPTAAKWPLSSPLSSSVTYSSIHTHTPDVPH
jgi:hypothetical protein